LTAGFKTLFVDKIFPKADLKKSAFFVGFWGENGDFKDFFKKLRFFIA